MTNSPAPGGARGQETGALRTPVHQDRKCVSGKGTPFLLSARLRLRRAVPGDKRRAHFASPLTLADNMQVISFMQERKRSEKALRSFLPLICCPARTADKRPPRPASCQSPPPKAFPALGIHPASGTTSLLVVKRCSMGHNASSFQDYREIHQFSQRYRLRYAQRRGCSGTC